MYKKPNKTEKKIIRAWQSADIDEAYSGLFNSGWDADISVALLEGEFCQHLPKVHPDIIPLLAKVPYHTSAVLSEALAKGHMTVETSAPCVRRVKMSAGGLLRMVYETPTGLIVIFNSPVNIVCQDKHGVVIWEVKLVHGGVPCVHYT